MTQKQKIEIEANDLYGDRESPRDLLSDYMPNAYRKQGYIAAATKYTEEIERLKADKEAYEAASHKYYMRMEDYKGQVYALQTELTNLKKQKESKP